VSRVTTIALAAWLVGGAGCFADGCLASEDDDDDGGFFGDWPEPPAPGPPPKPPSITQIEIASWPPLGPTGTVSVTAEDDVGLEGVRFRFASEAWRHASGTEATVKVTGADLGEGLGTLVVGAEDVEGARATRWVEDLLVDLSPPEIFPGPTLLGAGSALELWVADAWVLGDVKLVFAGVTLERTFDPGYPSSLGHDWDYSLVIFPVSELPATSGMATIVARDAAGNVATADLALTVDLDPPVAEILAPAQGATLSGVFTVEIGASDPGGGAVWISLRVGGAEVATGVGPAASFALDADAFGAGPLSIEATPTDLAGNVGEGAAVAVTLE
jgi:hypothetical protein